MIAILGGTFDPIHFGHLRPALDVLQALDLDEVRFIPCRVPPHRAAPWAGSDQRLAMLRAALDGERGLAIDERELCRSGPSYMFDTLGSLREELGTAPLCLILGMDAFHGLTGWHRWRELVDLCHLLVVSRPGWSFPEQGELARLVDERRVSDAALLRERPAGKLLFFEVTQLGISASRIRTLVAAGHSIRYLVPDAVLNHIEAHGLYRNSGTVGTGR